MTPPPDTPARRDAEATRRKLVAAALELFTTTGFHATTTPMIAVQAGTAEGTIYRHFTGKEALLNAAYREAQAWGLQVIRNTEGERSARARLLVIAQQILAESARRPAVVRMLLQRQDDRYLDAASRDSGRAFTEALHLVVAGGKSDGVVRAGPAELWAGVWIAVVGFAADRVASGEWTPENPQAALALDAGWEAIAASGSREKT